MTNEELQLLRYPVGVYTPKENITEEDIKGYISKIESFPEKLNLAVKLLTDEQLDTEYRPGGWTIRQVVHHTADSHINSYTRFKLALTEDKPAIRPYLEEKWAELPDAKSAPVELSLRLLEALHNRWAVMLKNITIDELKRTYYHPETGNESNIGQLMGLYAWHSEHHLAHIVNLKKRMNWD